MNALPTIKLTFCVIIFETAIYDFAFGFLKRRLRRDLCSHHYGFVVCRTKNFIL